MRGCLCVSWIVDNRRYTWKAWQTSSLIWTTGVRRNLRGYSCCWNRRNIRIRRGVINWNWDGSCRRGVGCVTLSRSCFCYISYSFLSFVCWSRKWCLFFLFFLFSQNTMNKIINVICFTVFGRNCRLWHSLVRRNISDWNISWSYRRCWEIIFHGYWCWRMWLFRRMFWFDKIKLIVEVWSWLLSSRSLECRISSIWTFSFFIAFFSLGNKFILLFLEKIFLPLRELFTRLWLNWTSRCSFLRVDWQFSDKFRILPLNIPIIWFSLVIYEHRLSLETSIMNKVKTNSVFLVLFDAFFDTLKQNFLRSSELFVILSIF